MMIQLEVLLPTEVLIEQAVKQVSAEAHHGAFTLLPRHIDCAVLVVPGLFSFVTENDEQVYLAMAEGVLVKRGFDVRVSTRNAVRGEDIDTLWETVREEFRQLDDRERRARSVIASLESALARQIQGLGGEEP